MLASIRPRPSKTTSVTTVIESDPTLGEVTRWCHVTTFDPPGPLAWNGA
jgi:hypothetical protein